MANREQRSMNAEMRRGATEGTYKQTTPDWSINTDSTAKMHVAGELCSEMYGTIPLNGGYDDMPLGAGIPSGTA
jgi:hypothetical protein